MKIVVLSTVHRTSDPRILDKQCCSLADAGHDVTLIAVADSSERCDGVEIIAIPRAKNRLHRVFAHSWRALGMVAEQRPDVCHMHDPELVPVGLALKLRGIKIVYDVHEDLPAQVMSKAWIAAPLRRLTALGARMLQLLACYSFDLVIAATPKIAGTFPASQKVVTVRNYPILDRLLELGSGPPEQRPAVVAYVGGVSRVRGATQMVEAISRVAHPEAEMVLAGDLIPPGLADELRALKGAYRTTMLGRQTRNEVAELLGRSRIGLCLLHPIPNLYDALPTKLFEYMAAGVPVIASDFPTFRKIVDPAACGILVDPLDTTAVAKAIDYLLDHSAEAQAMGERGRRTARELYDWRTEERVLLAAYEQLEQSTKGGDE